MKKIALAMLVLLTTLSATLTSVAYAEGSCGCSADGCGDNTKSVDAQTDKDRDPVS